jgi:type I restriction enzyme R subunit
MTWKRLRATLVGRTTGPATGRSASAGMSRATSVKKGDYFARYGEQARAVLEAVLSKYADDGVEDIADLGVLKVAPLTALGTPKEIVDRFGGRDGYLKAVRELERELYRAS